MTITMWPPRCFTEYLNCALHTMHLFNNNYNWGGSWKGCTNFDGELRSNSIYFEIIQLRGGECFSITFMISSRRIMLADMHLSAITDG